MGLVTIRIENQECCSLNPATQTLSAGSQEVFLFIFFLQWRINTFNFVAMEFCWSRKNYMASTGFLLLMLEQSVLEDPQSMFFNAGWFSPYSRMYKPRLSSQSIMFKIKLLLAFWVAVVLHVQSILFLTAVSATLDEVYYAPASPSLPVTLSEH